MQRSRGFKLGRKLVKIFKWAAKPKRKHQIMDHHQTKACNPITKVCRLVRSLQRGAKGLCSPRSKSGYKKLGQEDSFLGVPKGHLAVYIGSEDDIDDANRVLVPVIYFNHPLFSELLKEAESVYGYNHPGGITIPCGMSEFEKVKTRIAAGDNVHRRSWKRWP